MTGIPLHLIDPPPLAYRPLIDDGTIKPGDCWPDDFGDTRGWAVVLPNGNVWHTWQPASDGICWDVTGKPPVTLTAHPSIFDHSPGNEWHGWLRGGKLVDA
jgi:hypothetical protein